MESITITVITQQGAPIEGASIRMVNDAFNKAYDQVTDSNGTCTFLVPADTYVIVGYHTEYLFKNMRMTVGSSGVFSCTIRANANVLLNDPINNKVCRVHGIVYDSQMRPYLKELKFLPEFPPSVIDGCVIYPANVVVTPDQMTADKTHYFDFCLYRGAIYTFFFDDMEYAEKKIYVPDLPQVNLSDLLFPAVNSITTKESGPFVMPKGERILSITPVIHLSSGVVLDSTMHGDLQWSVSDDLPFSITTKQLIFYRSNISKPGVYQITAKIRSYTRAPTPIDGLPITITIEEES